mmetsp:Transcript_45270/g.127505  ORF Transcript_45270/g.127505 Transcript_45270/m.127505 type:complete len:113 (+) Transcript_45270:70-408(+)
MEGAVVWGSVLVVSVKNTFIHCQLSPKSEALSLTLRRCTSEPTLPSTAQCDDDPDSSPTEATCSSGRAARRRARPSKAKRRRWNRWEAAQKAEEEEDTPTHESQGLLPPAVA